MNRSRIQLIIGLCLSTLLFYSCSPLSQSTVIPTPIPLNVTNTANPTLTFLPTPTLKILPTPTDIPETDLITGKVYVLDTNMPIQVTVLLLDASSEDTLTVISTLPTQKTISNTDGIYTFRNVKPGTYIVAVEGNSKEVSFCGDNFGFAEFAVGPTPKWTISYMRLDEKFAMNSSDILQQDIIIKCK